MEGVVASEIAPYLFIAGGLLALPTGFTLVWLYGKVERRFMRPLNSDKLLRIRVARIASDLIPLVQGLKVKDHLKLNSTEMWLLGSDGRYFLKGSKGERWAKQLRAWCDDGLNIKYILLGIEDEVRERLRSLDLPTDRMAFLVADEAKLGDDKGLLARFETEHPTLFISEGGSPIAAWIEGMHARDSDLAYDVVFISPNAMRSHHEQRSRCERYKRELTRLMGGCEPVNIAA